METDEGRGPRLSCPIGWRVWGHPLTPHIPATLAGPPAAPGPRLQGGCEPRLVFRSWGLAQQSPRAACLTRAVVQPLAHAICTGPFQNLVNRRSGPEGLWVPRTRGPLFPEGSQKAPLPLGGLLAMLRAVPQALI